MNRHQRRAAERQQTAKEPEVGVSSITTPVDRLVNAPTHKPALITRLLATVLLSRWVLARVQHPDVERLLINFATEAGRFDVADDLARRQAMRGQNQSSPRSRR
jgi:hypothetical protein